ncbi:MAG: FAD-binding oxidoreductase [Burkholderiales bacterium]|nr:FAD-binding oxidoreductase [Burkholderiales bacterium]ODU56089.1 MAG: FAD-dependent oxidoreductase [Comamonadaceae bacterium SCN 68-20]
MSSDCASVQTDVAIVGGGIAGSSTALALRRMGIGVVLIERDLCGSRASGVNYGGVRRQGRPVSQLPLSQRAHEIWQRLPELIGTDGEYVRSGHLKLARSPADMAALESYYERTKEFGLDLQLISGASLRAAHPWLGQKVVGGSLCPMDGHANPRIVSPAFARAAQRAGAHVMERTAVQSIEHDGDTFFIRCENDVAVRARSLVNCAGAWAGAIAEQFGEPVPMQPAYPAMAVTEPLPFFLPWSTGVEGGGLYFRQVARGNVVVGGGRGRGIDDYHVRSTREATMAILAQSLEIMPHLRGAQIIRTWSGTEGFTADRLPILGPSMTTPGLIHGFGFSGAGFQIGVAVGEVLAELVRDGRSPTPIESFSIRRFANAEPTLRPPEAARHRKSSTS